MMSIVFLDSNNDTWITALYSYICSLLDTSSILNKLFGVSLLNIRLMNSQEKAKKIEAFSTFLENKRLIQAYIKSGLKSKELEEEISKRGIKFATPAL